MQGKLNFPPSPVERAAYCFLTALGILLLCAAMPLAYGQGTDLVVNGGFEADPVPPYPGYTGTITGWTLGGGDVLNNASGPFYQPANGPIPEGSMVYGHQGGGAISQVITGLSHGANCTLKFYRNLRVTAPMTLTALMGSHTLWGPTRILTTNPFQEHTINFVYDSSWGNTLRFSFTLPEGDATILLDHVRLFVSYTVTPSVTGGNGTIAPNTAQTVNAGGSSAFTMTPNSGYRLSQVLIDGTRIDDLSTTYTFTNIYANHTIAASFALPDWTFDTAGYFEGWSPYGHIASSEVSGGLLRYDITTTATDPMWGSQRLTLPRAGYRWLRVIAKNETKCTGSIMFWDDNTIGGFTGGYQHNYPINPHDTQLTEYWVDLNAHALWMAATTIEQFRFDFPDSAPTSPLGNDGTHVDTDRITLLPDGSGPPPPQITSILRYNPTTAPPNYTNAAQVTWEVRFNHTMTTVAANDFGFTATGTASGAVATVTRIGPTWYRVTANVSGTGTLRLNGVTGGSGRDVANQAISTGYTSGELYNIDREGPAVSIGAPSTTLTKSGPVTYSVTYTDAGSGFSASTLAPANITLNATGTAAGTIGVSGSGATRTVTISGITGTGTLGINIAAGTATDILGNTSPAAGPSATFVVDNTPPTALCKDITVTLSAATIGPDAINNGSSDNVAIASLTINGGVGVTYTCANLGNNTATLGVTDTAGNYAQCTATVTVVDDIDPNPVCQNITVNLSAPEVAAATIDGGSSDNCGTIAGLLINGAATHTFLCADMPSTVATLTVSDPAGNTATCPATVTVVDDVIPVIAMNGASPVTVECGATYTDGGATANDNCDGPLVPSAASTVNTAVVGNYTVTYTVSDAAGNAAVPVVRQVNVVDTTAPVITRTGSAAVTVECPNTYTDSGATADDACYGDLTSTIITVNPVDTSVPNTYTVTYDVTDVQGNVATQVVRTVTVQDTTPPVITLTGSDPVTVECGGTYSDAGATASDTCDGDLTTSISTINPVNPAVVGTYTVTYDVADGAGNNAVQVTRTVNVVDTTIPVIALNGSDPVTVECGGTYSDAGATANDSCAGDLTASISTINPVNPAVVGTYTVTYDVTDGAGNNAVQVTRTVNVVDTTIPVIALNGSDPVTVECGGTYSDAGATANDSCAGDLTASISIINPVNPAVVGTYTVTYDVADGAGNNAVQVTRTVNVVDTTIPVITLNGSDPVTVECGGTYSDAGATANDSCAGDLTASISTINPVNPTVVGTYTVTYDVADGAGNTAVQVTRTVNVVDTTIPVIALNGSDPVTVEYGGTYSDAGAMASDTCDGDLTAGITTNNPVNTAVAGTYTVTYDVADGAGNNAVQETRTVNVVDTTAPVITVNGDASITIERYSSYTDAGATADDACDGALTVVVNNPVNTDVVGVYTITYNVTDSEGNAATEVTRTVTVEDLPAEGEGEPPIEGEGEPPVEGEGEPPVEGEGEPPIEGEGEPPVEGEGEPPIEGEGEPPVEGEGEPPVEGEGEPPIEGEGEPPVEGEGEPPVEGEGEPGELVVTAGQTYFLLPEGASVTFEVLVSGAQGALTYQWYRLTPDKAYTGIPDATDAVYTIDDIASGDAGEYQCEVYDDVLLETAWSPVFTLELGTGVPLAGMLGLAAAIALTGLGSALMMRRRRQ